MLRSASRLLGFALLTVSSTGAFAAAPPANEPTGCAAIASAGAPVGGGACPGVRPGTLILPSGCTLNFLFRGSDDRDYMGTAGHCVLGSGSPVEVLWEMGSGPEVRVEGRRIGEFAYARFDYGAGLDFAIIRLDQGVSASPQLCYWGGPVEMRDDAITEPTPLRYYGNGVGVSRVIPARTAVALGAPSGGPIWATGIGVPGDSGSGIITQDGAAIGLISSISAFAGISPEPQAGTILVSRLAPQLARATSKLGISLSIQTAPLTHT